MKNHVPLDQLNQKLKQAGSYKLSEQSIKAEPPASSLKDFIPLIIIFASIILLPLFANRKRTELVWAMHDFMARSF